MAVNHHVIDEIVSDPNVRGGRPVIRGTGLKVSDIVLRHTTGDKLSLEQIAENYRLPLAQVYAAMTHYHLHRAEIDKEIETDRETAERMIAELEHQGKLRRLE